MKGFFAALQFLTIFPGPSRAQRTAEEIGASAIFFPVIGLLLGLCLTAVDRALQGLSSLALNSTVLVAMLAWLTRGLHLDGWADTFDGLGGGGDRQSMLRIMSDSRTGAFGVIAVVLLLFLKIHGLESIETNRWRALLAAPVLGRWAMVLFAYRSEPARPGLGAVFLRSLSGRQLALASVITVSLVLALFPLAGLALTACVAIIAFGARYYFHRRLGGITGDTCGAVCELSETSVWVLLALGTK